MRIRALFAAALLAAPCTSALPAQQLTRADSALVARLLLAEENRDTSSAAYADGTRHTDARIRTIAQRGLWRSRDPLFARRDSLPALPAPTAHGAEPAWRLRFRELTARSTCEQLLAGVNDAAPQVKTRAADLVTSACASDTAIIRVLKSWLPSLPTAANRQPNAPSWHLPAHAYVALSRTAANEDMRREMPRFATSPIPQVRVYTAQAAALLADTATLVRLARDMNDNVKEAAISALARIAPRAADNAAIDALGAQGYQAVRAAARALAAAPNSGAVLTAAITNAVRLRRDSSETSRDARMALVDLIARTAAPQDWARIAPLAADFDCGIADSVAAIGRKLGQARAAANCSALRIALPPDAVSLALGADVRLRVTMADASGGGTIIVKLRGDIAPVMAGRVLDLARRGYYDGRPWHRVEHNFVVQGGGGGSEYVGYPRFFRDELGNVPHARGTIGMSTRGHDTGDAQWFFNLIDNFRLNRDYTVFAEVVEGMNVVDGILEGDIISKIEIVR